MNSLNSFRMLSEVLCGETSLSHSLAEDYYLILSSEIDCSALILAFETLLAQSDNDNIEAILKTQLAENITLREGAKKIIKLWYFGRAKNILEMRSERHYYHYEALIWKTLHAHPPGLSGGYFGHWAYQPELQHGN